MDAVSHLLTGLVFQNRSKARGLFGRLWVVAFAALPDLPVAVIYLLLGRENGRPWWIPLNQDWEGLRTSHPAWATMWDVPHSLTFWLVVVVPLVLLLRIPAMAILAYLGHLLLDAWSHTGEWAMRIFWPLEHPQISGVTDAWSWPLQYMAISWAVIIGLLILLWGTRRSESSSSSGAVAIKVPGESTTVRPAGVRVAEHTTKEAAKGIVDDLRFPFGYISMWYESYQTVMRWIGNVAAGMLTFTVSLLAGDLLRSGVEGLGRVSKAFQCFQVSFAVLATCLVLVLTNLLVTYMWLVLCLKHCAGLEFPEKVPNPRLDDMIRREIASYGVTGTTMKLWGNVSYILGIVAGALLFAGIILYLCAAWRILSGDLQ